MLLGPMALGIAFGIRLAVHASVSSVSHWNYAELSV